MLTVYRLENQYGEGYWFKRNGQPKFDGVNFISQDEGLSAFKHIESFAHSFDYYTFYNDKEYDLYEITLKNTVKECKWRDEIIFLEDDIIEKHKITKPLLTKQFNEKNY